MATPIPDHSSRHRHADVVVVGAGVFGTAMAITLARQSRSVLLLERSLMEPNRIVGELLQPGGVQALENLGLRNCLDNIDAVPVKGYHILFNRRAVTIPYPIDASRQHEYQQPPRLQGASFHHGRFVQRLRSVAAEENNITIIETDVSGLVKVAGETGRVLGVKSSTGDSNNMHDYYFAPLTIVADGYRSKFRSEIYSRKPASTSKFWALELQDAALPSPGFGHVLLGDFSPILLYQIGTHETRALINVPEGLPSAKPVNGGIQQYIRDQVLPHLPPGVQPAFTQSLDKGRLRCMPNSFLPAATNRTAGLVVAGDALNMRHPLTGGGMTVALGDVVLLAELLSPSIVPDLGDADAILRQMRKFHWRRKNHASVINILAQALYALFAADDYYLQALRQGCFKYFERGGACVDGPAGLLAGVQKQPALLMYHFFAVALLSCWTLLVAQPAWRLPLGLVECCGVFLKAFWVILPYAVSEFAI